MFCGFCGKTIPDGSVFCPVCGARLAGAPAQQSDAPAQQPAAPAQQTYQPRPNTAQPNVQQRPPYGAPARPDYQRPPYGAPAQQGYQRPPYGAPAQPGYRQPPFGAPARPVYGAPGYPGASPLGGASQEDKFKKIGYALALALAALALAALAVAAIVNIVQYADALKDIADTRSSSSRMSSERSEYLDNVRNSYILYIVDNVFELICLGIFVILCGKAKSRDFSKLGIPVLLLMISDLKYVAASIFDFKIFDMEYKIETTDGVLLGFFIASAIMVIVCFNIREEYRLIAKCITAALLLTVLILAIVVMSDRLGELPGADEWKYYDEETRNSMAKYKTITIFTFLWQLFVVLSLNVTMFLSDFPFKKRQQPYATYA